MDLVELTKKLISIPSYVDSRSNEAQMGQFVFKYLNRIKWLKVKKQKVEGERFNLIATDGKPVKLLIAGHLDTVQPQKAWRTNPIRPMIKDGKIYGLGASDMKGSLACLIKAIEKTGPTQGLMLLFYVDEEYDFLGMKKFIKKYKNKVRPKFIVSGDGSNLEFGNGCRGLIEITFKIKGRSGHAALPDSGRNAIEAAYKAVENLKISLNEYADSNLGQSTCNLAFLKGGLNQGKNKAEKVVLGCQGNVIPDYTEFVLDIRPANPKLKAKRIIRIVKKAIKENGCQLTEAKIRHDLGTWLTPKAKIDQAISLVKKPRLANIGRRGYIDTQMLWKAFKKVPCLTFGPGESNCAHQANEYVKISSLIKAENFFTKLIKML